MSVETLIVIPSRYGSTRFPGKPLAVIAGQTMLQRVAVQARAAAEQISDAAFVVATDDNRIVDHCASIDAPVVMTDPAAPSGSDRVLEAARKIAPDFKFIVNLQGDAPFTPVHYLTRAAQALRQGKGDVATPCIRLDWAGLDALRDAKRQSPTSGTTCVMDADGMALWFSKTIIPAIRDEAALRTQSKLSPVHRHVGLYGFKRAALQQYTRAPMSDYEKIEGLEQLRMLENGISVHCVRVAAQEISTAGIDTPADLERLNAMIAKHGDPGVVD